MAIRPPLDGATVLITGASSGIGRELAGQLAPRVGGMALVARRKDRLEALAAELRSAHPRLEVMPLAADLAESDALQAIVERVEHSLGPVQVLVNNAGLGYYARYDEVDPARLQQLIAVNVTAPLLLTRAVLPGMVAAGRGGILNVGSGAGYAPMPGGAAYVASKFALTGFSETLRLELEGTGVTVTLLAPGPVPTEFNEVAGLPGSDGLPLVPIVSARQCAKEALRGFERGQAVVYPGRAYRWMMRALAVTPRPLVHLAARPMVRALEKLRS